MKTVESNQTVNILSVKKCREKTHSKRDGRLLWVYEAAIEGDERKFYCVIEPPLGEVTVSIIPLSKTEALLSRPKKPIKYA